MSFRKGTQEIPSRLRTEFCTRRRLFRNPKLSTGRCLSISIMRWSYSHGYYIDSSVGWITHIRAQLIAIYKQVSRLAIYFVNIWICNCEACFQTAGLWVLKSNIASNKINASYFRCRKTDLKSVAKSSGWPVSHIVCAKLWTQTEGVSDGGQNRRIIIGSSFSLPAPNKMIYQANEQLAC